MGQHGEAVVSTVVAQLEVCWSFHVLPSVWLSIYLRVGVDGCLSIFFQ